MASKAPTSSDFRSYPSNISSSKTKSAGRYPNSSASKRPPSRQNTYSQRKAQIPRVVSLTVLQGLPPLLCACCTCCNCCWICVYCYNKRNWQNLQQGCIFGAVILIGWGTVRCCFNLFQAMESYATDLSINEALVLKDTYNASVLTDVLVEPSWAVLSVLFEYAYNNTFFEEVPPSTAELKSVFYASAFFKFVCELAPGVILLIGAIRLNKTLLRLFLMAMVFGISSASVQYGIVLIYLVAFPLRTTYKECESGKDCYIGPLILTGISIQFAIVLGLRIHIFIAAYSLTKQIQISVLEKVPTTQDESVPLSLNDPYAFLTAKDVPRTSILVPKDIVKPEDMDNPSKKDEKDEKRKSRPGNRRITAKPSGRSAGKAAGKGGRGRGRGKR